MPLAQNGRSVGERGGRVVVIYIYIYTYIYYDTTHGMFARCVLRGIPIPAKAPGSLWLILYVDQALSASQRQKFQEEMCGPARIIMVSVGAWGVGLTA